MTEYVMEYDGWAEGIPVGEYLKVRDAMHARKREEVVRCRDCKHYSEHELVFATDVSDVCHFWHGEPMKVAPDGFCAWGKRKESK